MHRQSASDVMDTFPEVYKSPENSNRVEPRKEIKSSSDRAEKYGSRLCLTECDCICSQREDEPKLHLCPLGELCNCFTMFTFQYFAGFRQTSL